MYKLDKFIYVTCLFAFMAFTSWSASAICPKLTESRLSKKTLTALVQNPECQIHSLEDVLARLPKSFLSTYSLVYKSESLQGPHAADYQHPRVIAYGMGQDTPFTYMPPHFVLTFNGDPSQPGYNSLEMMETDFNAPPDGMFKFSELEFSSVGQVRISVDNPAKCIRCHDSPAKPILHVYPFWTGVYGSIRFPISEAQSQQAHLEEQQFLQFLQRAPAHSRYRFLKLTGFEDFPYIFSLVPLVDDLDARLKRGLWFSAARQIVQTPDYDKFRYAIAAGLLECPNWSAVLPPSTRAPLEENVDALFSLSSWSESKIWNLFQREFSGDNRELTDPGGKMKWPEAKAVIQSQIGDDPIYEQLQADTLKREGQSLDAYIPATLRLLMEGRGLRIDRWFLPPEPGTYQMTDGRLTQLDWLYALTQVDPQLNLWARTVHDILKNGDAKNDAALSLTTLHTFSFTQIDPNLVNLCRDWSDRSQKALAGYQVRHFKTTVHSGYPATFSQTCARCHSEADDVRAPTIPFDSPNEMASWLSEPKNRRNLLHRLAGRGGRVMPPDRWLTPAENQEILNYLGGSP